MRGFRFGTGLLWLALGLLGLSPAQAGGSLAGRSTPAGQLSPVTTGIGSMPAGSAVPSQNFSVYATAGLADGMQSATDNAVNLTASAWSLPNSSPNSITLQTNIDSTRYIDSATNVSVTDTVNGANVTYGGNGASITMPQSDALNVIDGVASYNDSISANSGPNITAVNDALDQANFLTSQQNNN